MTDNLMFADRLRTNSSLDEKVWRFLDRHTAQLPISIAAIFPKDF
jgi:hypothetical protein